MEGRGERHGSWARDVALVGLTAPASTARAAALKASAAAPQASVPPRPSPRARAALQFRRSEVKPEALVTRLASLTELTVSADLLEPAYDAFPLSDT